MMSTSMNRARACALLALSAAVPAGVQGCGTLSFDNAWVRQPPPVASVAAAYVTINNESDQAVVIDAVRSGCCEALMIHKTETVDGVSRMRHVRHLEVEAHGSLELEPGGIHLMLLRPNKPLNSGDVTDINFECGEASTRVEFITRRP